MPAAVAMPKPTREVPLTEEARAHLYAASEELAGLDCQMASQLEAIRHEVDLLVERGQPVTDDDRALLQNLLQTAELLSEKMSETVFDYFRGNKPHAV